MKRILGIAVLVALLMLAPAALWAQGDLTLEGLQEQLNALAEMMVAVATGFDERIAALESAVYTPTPTRKPTHTPTPTKTPMPTLTPTAILITPRFTVARNTVNVRSGPGTNYAIIGTVKRGQSYYFDGRNAASDWIRFRFGNGDGWVYAPLMTVTALLSVPIIQPPAPAPTATSPPAPTNTPRPAAQAQQQAPPQPNSLYGVIIAPENRCSPYSADDYSYPQSVEPVIVAQQGGRIYSPYSGRYFASTSETDIEHIVARSEAHDSGLCAASRGRRQAFARDLANLTLASPSLNRNQKIAKDLAEWLPPHNRCWYVKQVAIVKQKYGLTWDQAEANKAREVLESCTSTAMIFTQAPTPTPAAAAGQNALELYDDNGNGRITCAEARAHGIAPVRRGHPAYQYMNDRDGDGVVCE